MPKKNYIRILSLVAAILLAGCVRSDVPPCNYGADISFRYILNSSGKDLFNTEVGKIMLLVFDAAGVYQASYSGEGIELEDPAYAMHLPLAPGTYTVVAWGGYMRTYSVKGLVRGTSTLEDFRLEANPMTPQARNHMEISDLDELFHGMCRELVITDGQVSHATIDLTKDSKTIIVNVSGLENLPESSSLIATSSPLHMMMASDNGTYLFDNSIAPGSAPISFLPQTSVNENNTMISSSRMLRLMMGHSVNLHIQVGQSGFMVCNDNIIDLITSNPAYATQEDIDRQDVYTFDYQINSDVTFTIQVNGWTVRQAIPVI